MKNYSKIFVCIVVFALSNSSCKKLIEVQSPTTSITGTSVYSQDATAISVITGIYARMSAGLTSSAGTFSSLSLYPGLSADELTLFNLNATPYAAYYKNALSSVNSGFEYWKSMFPLVFTCNSALEGLTNSTTLTPEVKTQLMGEAKFARALLYFYLINLYGDVPLVLGTDYTSNALLPRVSKDLVYQQIINDLKEAESLLSVSFLDANLLKITTERIRPTKAAANALLARVYLFTGDWANAEIQSSAIINNTSLFSLIALNNVFLKNSKEAIWQLQPVNANKNTEDAAVFILPASGPNSSANTVYLSNNLISSFESGDQRIVNGNWIKTVLVGTTIYNYSYKYKSNVIPVTTPVTPVSEYLTVLRLAEQYLIRAEARAMLNNISGAQSDLNAIRTRAVLPNTTAADQPSLLTAILNERRHELFCELGQRWFDLKRTAKVDAVMGVATPIKGGTWNTNWKLYPLSQAEINLNQNLIQNPGY